MGRDPPPLEDLLPQVRQKPRGRRGGDGTPNASLVVDCEEPNSFRLEGPTLAVGAACGAERHRDPDAIGRELVCDCLPKRLGPSMHFHFDRCDGLPPGADKIRPTTENRDLQPNVESGVLKPCHDRATEV